MRVLNLHWYLSKFSFCLLVRLMELWILRLLVTWNVTVCSVSRALRLRKVLGGGMRQAGVLAAPGLLSLDVMSQRLHQDHATAKRLSEGRPIFSHCIGPLTCRLGATEYCVWSMLELSIACSSHEKVSVLSHLVALGPSTFCFWVL